jgi:adenylate cyclase
MTDKHIERRLAAILAADVVGFSRLASADEDRTLARLRALRSDLIDPTIAVHNGRVVKRTGDGAIVEFRSVVEAVRCAIEVQNAMIERNSGVPPDRRIEFRIGIHLGDIVEESDGDLMGDGVNIAARLEGVAAPGAICLSDDAYRQVKARLDLSVSDLGETQLKNIAEPMRIYSLRVGPSPEASSRAKSGIMLPEASTTSPNKPSIAVLPFTNMSGDGEQQYFSDGITEDIITRLSRFRELTVISRTSSFAFRGQAIPIAEIARKLGVQYVIEGSIRKSGNRVRVTAQLIDAGGDKHIWAEHYDREIEDIFALQDDLVHRITGTLVGKLESDRQDRAKRQSESELRAYDIYLRAREHFFNWSQQDNKKAARLLEKAIEVEPDYAAALALLSEVYLRDWMNGWSLDPQSDLTSSYRLAARSVELDEQDSRTHTAIGMVHLFRNDPDQAKHHFEAALRLNPSDARVLIYYSRHAVFSGNPQLGIEFIHRAQQLNPFGKYNWYLGVATFAAQRYEEAVELLRNVRDPSQIVVALLAGSLAELDRVDEANAACKRFFELAAETPMMKALKDTADWRDYFAARWLFRDKADLEHLFHALRKGGLPI